MHHTDTATYRTGSVPEIKCFAFDLDLTRVWPNETEYCFDQSRLASAILTEERDDLSWFDLEGDPIVGYNGSKCLADVLDL